MKDMKNMKGQRRSRAQSISRRDAKHAGGTPERQQQVTMKSIKKHEGKPQGSVSTGVGSTLPDLHVLHAESQWWRKTG